MSRFDKYFYSILLVFILYITIGFKLIPYVIKDQMVKNLDNMLTLKTKVENVEFNPFIFKAKILGFSLNKEDEKIIAFEHFLLDFQAIKSLFNSHINLKTIELNKAYIKIVENKDGTFNFQSFLKERKKEKKKEELKEENKAALEFLLSELNLINAKIDFYRISDDYKLSLNNINYSLYDIGTYKNSLASSNFSLKINKHTNLNLKGAISLAPLFSYGKLSLDDLRIKELIDYKKELFNFYLEPKANANIHLSYDFKKKEQNEVLINMDLFNINNIHLKQNQKTILKLKTFAFDLLKLDLTKQKIAIKDIRVEELYAKAIKTKEALNFATLLRKDSTRKEEAKEKKKESKPWNIDINNIALNSLKTIYDDRNTLLYVDNKTNIKIDDIKVEDKIFVKKVSILDNTTSFRDKKNNLALDSKLNLYIDNINKTENISLDKIELINKSLNLKQKELRLNSYANKAVLNSLKLQGNDIDISKFSFSNNKTQIKQKNQKINSSKLKLELDKIKLKNKELSFAFFKLYENSLKVNNSENKTNLEVKAFDFRINEFLKKNTNEIVVKSSSINKPIISFTMEKNTAKKEQKIKEKKKTETKTAKKEPLKLNISALDTTEASTTKLNLDGQINKYGLAKITGIVDPNNIKILTDINIILRNIAIKDFSAYSGKFIGRKIDSGKLDVNLKYNILKSDLDAKNNIIITKIKFGEDVQSKDALSLPIGLAIALLEDSEGIINLNIPVSGNIDDPKFEIAPLVWMTLKNLITKAVTAPFKLLGSLFGFDEAEIKEIPFDYGQNKITVIQKEPLDKIIKILEKKHKLKIKLTASYNKIEDKRALQEKKFQAELKKVLPNTQAKNYKKNYLSFLENRYKKSNKNLEQIKKEYLKKKEYKKFLEEFYLDSIKISQYELEKLALNRIYSIENYLRDKINPSQLELNKDVDVFEDSSNTLKLPVKLTSNN